MAANAERVTSGIEHNDVALLPMGLVMRRSSSQRLQPSLGLLDIIDRELKVYLHRNVRLRPGR